MVASARTFARAALAGNPSDGYGGRTLAVCLADWTAEANFVPAPTFRVEPGSADLERLVAAALTRLVKIGAIPCVAGEVRVRTTIPREVGLAGSSAVVIAVMRAAAAAHGVELTAATLADEALAAEVEELGIAAGPQDRVVQAHEGLVYMDFASGHVETIDPALLPPLLVAHRRGPARHSGMSHSSLRARFERGDPDVLAALVELADAARRAARALRERNHAAFAAELDRSFDLRAQMMDVDADEVEGIAIARHHGAAANYAGSGGAVVAAPSDEDTGALVEAFSAAGWEARPLRVAAPIRM